MSRTERNRGEIEVVVDGLDHPECVAVDQGGSIWAGGEAGQLYHIDSVTGTVTLVGSTGGFILGVTPDGDGHVWLCDLSRQELICMDGRTGAIVHVVSEVEGVGLTNPNYAVFDEAGNLYVSDSGHLEQRDGFVFVVRPDGQTQIIDREANAFPNGMALSADGRTLYIVESDRPGIRTLSLETGESREFVSLPGICPDGVALAENNDLFVACYRPDAILRITPEGFVTTYVEDPRGVTLSAPTNIAFGGPDRNELYIASLGRWHLGRLTMAVPGLALHYPVCRMGGKGERHDP